jgi:transposase
MKQTPEAVDISVDEYTKLLQRVEQKTLLEQDWNWILKILRAYHFFLNTIEHQKISIRKLKTLLFGKKTEKNSKKPNKTSTTVPDPGALPEVGNPETSPPADSTSGNSNNSPENPKPKSDQKPKPPGHGRRGYETWGVEPIYHSHHLKPGCPCPKCKTGTLYLYKEPAVWVRFVGQSPLVPEVHELERLRCNPCGALFTATPPGDLQKNPTSTPEARATAAIFKYQAATPFNRMAEIEKNFGYPIPRTRLWEMSRELAESVKPVLFALIEFAAQGQLVQNDDTGVKVLELIKEVKTAEKAGIQLNRTGMFTSVIVSRVGERRVYLFFSSRNHAGENLAKVLKARDPTLPPPTQVCDASSMNTSPGASIVEIGGCHDHARRNFFAIKESYPKSSGYALGIWELIYKTDAEAKERKLDAEARLLLHQKESAPAMERLYQWCNRMIDEKQVEPNNSYLGDAIQYFLDHYSKLTLFLRKPGIPLSNCECEQALKTPIVVRKMAYFFKTLKGAEVGDLMFSFIATCKSAGVNLFEYLVALQNNEKKLSTASHLWLPWNYQQQLPPTNPSI